MRLLVVILMAIGLVSSDSLSAQTDDAPFRQLLQTFLESWNKHDAHAFAEIFSTDALITTVGGTRVRGRGEIEKYLQPRFDKPRVR